MRTASPAPATRAALWSAFGALLLLVLLGWGVVEAEPWLLAVDRTVGAALYAGDDRSRALEVLLQIATAPGLSAVRGVVFLPVLIWLVLRRCWWTAGWVLTATALVGPLTTLLKEVAGRARPQFAEGGARLESLSYPSGHASGVATLVTVGLVLLWPVVPAAWRRVWLAAGVALAVLVGLTRLWLGVHYPSDVIGGWALGVGWSLLVAVAFGALPGGRAALRPRVAEEVR